VLSKKIDHMVAGCNYLSLIFGLVALDREQSCLILDDTRFGLDEENLTSIDQIKVELLRTIGEKYALAPLQNIERYLVPHPLYILQNNMHLRLGRTPWENIQEIRRKISSIIKWPSASLPTEQEGDEQNFNRIYIEIADLAAKQIFSKSERDGDNNHLSTLLTNPDLPFGREVAKLEKAIMHYGMDWLNYGQFASLINSTSSHLMGMPLYPPHRDNQTIRILHAYALLSPIYQLDTLSLTNDLMKQFVLSGGIHKKSKIKSSAIHRQRVWALELDSFDGLYHPEYLHLFDSNLSQTPFSFAKELPSYESVIVLSHYHDLSIRLPPNGEHILLDQLSWDGGGNYPLTTLTFPTNSSIKACCYLPYRKGRKIDFIQPKLSAMLDQLLWKNWGIPSSKLKSRSISPAKKAIPQRHKFCNELPQVIEISPANLVKSDPLINCFYHGPLANLTLGNTSLLLETLTSI
jgi:hypothetical protein